MVARHDKTTNPNLLDGLLQARRGTAFFARKLNELNDEELDDGSLLPGWTRRHVVAHVGYNARAIARLIEWAGTGVETPMYVSAEARNHEIDFGATLPPFALRNLFDHSAIHLSVEWRDLAADAWHAKVKTAQGRVVAAEETIWMRTREVWVHAVDLANGATFSDIPVPVLERLLKDITGVWKTRGTDIGLIVRVTGRQQELVFGDIGAEDPVTVSGTLADVASWATGRDTAAVTAGRAGTITPVVSAPAWI
ncbi:MULTISPECIES: maleylpyruvate isomerase family mycothiol-dependent enzyme [Paenarthrobacter]|uniref:Maleylpyruvate isomerase family mycothiol-dependent enzyme n=1 Tax=Paenarthrobacter aromaticivorans TaxID=2849150 RepID=A0ABS6IBV2_9MICC|nr:maleylpyruvate isomerase family mycothiol-dependent enzyme [Paenarthrobacter sp. MMS21-TAE1-1]MBU8868554.1 maleylpyruvate isomerase family mycothiol-dependent enzyme [Paenarthrobacter sp. MMS21-TAE1-1]